MSTMRDALAKAQTAICKTLGSDKIYNSVDRDKRLAGMKIPALAYQIFIQADALPYAIHGSSAPPHVGKTWLAIMKGIWNIMNGGFTIYVDTEHKGSVDMVKTMVRKMLPKEQWDLFKTVEAHSIEEWQQAVMTNLKVALENREASSKKEDRFGIFVIVDSLLGKGTADSVDTLLKEGHAKGRGYKEEVLMIKNFVEAFDTRGAFFSLYTIQHAKKSLDPNAKGVTAFTVTGGDAPRFAAMTHCFMQRADQWESVDEDGIAVEGHNIRMTVMKNGLGGDRRTIYAGLRWRNLEGPDGKAYQETWFDWNWSLGWMLAQSIMESKYVPAKLKNDLQAIIKFSVLNKNNVNCERFGGKITYENFGKNIEADPELRAKLQALFGVRTIQDYRDIDFSAGSAAPEEASQVVKAKKRGRPSKAETEAAEIATQEELDAAALAEPVVVNDRTKAVETFNISDE